MGQQLVNGPHLQSGLGAIRSISRKDDRDFMQPSLELAIVKKVHPKRCTADIQLINSTNHWEATGDTEGFYSAMICVPEAGIDELTGKPYGSIPRIQPNSLVLVGFIGSGHYNPVIISPLHYNMETLGEGNHNSVLMDSYSRVTDGQMRASTTISGTGDYSYNDGIGNSHKVTASKAFFGTSSTPISIDGLECPKTDREPHERFKKNKYYFVGFYSGTDPSSSDKLAGLINEASGTAKLAKVQREEKTATFLSLEKDGSVVLQRSLDTNKIDGIFPAKNYSQLKSSADGTVSITYTNGVDTTSTITIHPDNTGITIETTGNISIKSGGDVSIETGGNFNVTSSEAHIN